MSKKESNNKTEQVNFRATKQTKEKLYNLARESNRSLGNYIDTLVEKEEERVITNSREDMELLCNAVKECPELRDLFDKKRDK